MTLLSLPADFDLYIGEINPDTNGLYFDVNDDIYTVYNSSTNPGLEPELVFGRLNPGDYWLQIVPRVGGNEELLDVEFEWSLDGQTFDETTLLSNDEFLPLQWHLFNTGIVRNWSDIGGQWLSAPNVDIGAPEAWNLVFNADIPIAIIDSGVDVTHPDLISNLWVNPGEIPGNSEDDDNNGFTDDTSMASPMIAGMAGLIRSQDSSITATETLAILRAGAIQNRRLRFGVNQNFQANLYRSLLLAQGWQGPDTLTGIGQDIAPVLNLSSLTTAQRLTGTLDWSGQTP